MAHTIFGTFGITKCQRKRIRTDLIKHTFALKQGCHVIRIDQDWVWRSHQRKRKQTEWCSRLERTVEKIMGGEQPALDELFLSDKPGKYFNHPCYQQLKKIDRFDTEAQAEAAILAHKEKVLRAEGKKPLKE